MRGGRGFRGVGTAERGFQGGEENNTDTVRSKGKLEENSLL